MRPILLLLPAAALLTGCVSSGKYEALQREFDQTSIRMQERIDERDARIEELEANLAGGNERMAELDARIEELRAELRSSEADRDAVQAELAQVLKDRSRLQGSVEEMQRALAEQERRRREAEVRVREFRDLVARFQPLIDTGRLQVKMVDGRMVVELATDVLFSSGSARLSRDGREAIREVADVLASIPDRQYQVEGHTDNVPIETNRYPSNWELAAARAITVVKEMVEGGVAPTRVSAASFAEFKPTASNRSREGRARNRRIEIVLIPDLSSLPGFDELQQVNARAGD